jgi:tRNA (guanine-N7-)-methyltransferase
MLRDSRFFARMPSIDVRTLRGLMASSIEIEIGSSHGDFLCRIASQHPDRNFVGIELVGEKCEDARQRLSELKLNNVRIIHAEAHAYIRNHVTAASIAAIHVYYPTPYPNSLNSIHGIAKPVHGRLISPSFTAECHRILIADGVVRIATDHIGYFQHAVDLFSTPLFSLVPWHSPLAQPSPQFLIGTSCERKFWRKRPVNYAQFVRLFVSETVPQMY